MRAIYRTNLKRFALLMLPTFFRKPIIQAILYAGISPLLNVQRRFAALRIDVNYQLTHNGQVCYLLAALNDRFDRQQRRIGIKEVDIYDYVRFYPKEDGKPVFFSKDECVNFYHWDKIGVSSVDFIILVPKEVYTDDRRIEFDLLVKFYKLTTKRFLIQII